MQDSNFKWMPFNSVINGNIIKKEINNEHKKINKPTLSEDQIEFLNDIIFESYTNHIKINIFIFKNNNIIKLNGYINNINKNMKYITLNNTHIYFNQILKITKIL